MVRARSVMRGFVANMLTRRGRFFRSSGSPPVRRTFSTPSSVNSSTSLVTSSKREQILAWEPGILLFWHAVLATEVTTIGHRHTQIAQRASKGINEHRMFSIMGRNALYQQDRKALGSWRALCGAPAGCQDTRHHADQRAHRAGTAA